MSISEAACIMRHSWCSLRFLRVAVCEMFQYLLKLFRNGREKEANNVSVHSVRRGASAGLASAEFPVPLPQTRLFPKKVQKSLKNDLQSTKGASY